MAYIFKKLFIGRGAFIPLGQHIFILLTFFKWLLILRWWQFSATMNRRSNRPGYRKQTFENGSQATEGEHLEAQAVMWPEGILRKWNLPLDIDALMATLPFIHPCPSSAHSCVPHRTHRSRRTTRGILAIYFVILFKPWKLETSPIWKWMSLDDFCIAPIAFYHDFMPKIRRRWI